METAALPNVTVRLLPFAAGTHPASNGAFTLFDFAEDEDEDEDEDPRIVCIDTLITTLYREGQREVWAYRLAFERLRALAMSPDDTVAFLRSVIQEGGA